MYLCDATDGAPFGDQQEQAFEDAEQQQHFEEGKWTLDHACCPIIYPIFTFTLYAMHESII